MKTRKALLVLILVSLIKVVLGLIRLIITSLNIFRVLVVVLISTLKHFNKAIGDEAILKIIEWQKV